MKLGFSRVEGKCGDLSRDHKHLWALLAFDVLLSMVDGSLATPVSSEAADIIFSYKVIEPKHYHGSVPQVTNHFVCVKIHTHTSVFWA